MGFGEIDAMGNICYKCGRLVRDHAHGFDCGPGTHQPSIEKDEKDTKESSLEKEEQPKI